MIIKSKKALQNVLEDGKMEAFISVAIVLISSVLVFWGNYNELKAQVLQNSQDIDKKVNGSELRVMIESQEKMSNLIDKRLDRMEVKIDKLYEKVK